MRGDGRTFKRGAAWWIAFYVDGGEHDPIATFARGVWIAAKKA